MRTQIGITGCEGYLGSALLDYLVKGGRDVVGLSHRDGDIADTRTIERVFGQTDVSTIVHLAGVTGVEKSWASAAEFFDVNVVGARCVAEHCVKRSVRLILVSSYLYGNCENVPADECAPLEATNPYTHSKLLAEEVCKFYKRYMGLDLVIARPANVYGGDQQDTFLVPFLIDQARDEETDRIVARDHKPVRDFIYIKDVMSGLCSLLDYEGDEYVFNLGTGVGHNVQEVATLITDLWGPGKRFVSRGDTRKNEVDISLMSIDRIVKETGWKPEYSLRQGLLDMYRKEQEQQLSNSD